MKNLFVYYSFEGNCRDLAQSMAGGIGGDTAAIEPAEDKTPRGFMKYLVGGGAVIFRETPAIRPLAVDMAAYDLVFVGTPVWCWNMTPPVRTFLSSAEWSGRKVALFSMCRGGKGFTLSAMRKLVEAKGANVVGAASFVDLRMRNPDATRAKALAWAVQCVAACGESGRR